MVFYKDPSLTSLISVLSQSIIFIPTHDLLLLPKLAEAVYDFLKDLFTLNPLIVSFLDQDVFNLYMNIIVTGLTTESIENRVA